MECDEKEFGCLCKNVGGHFPCLFHGLNVKKIFFNNLNWLDLILDWKFMDSFTNGTGGKGELWTVMDYEKVLSQLDNWVFLMLE